MSLYCIVLMHSLGNHFATLAWPRQLGTQAVAEQCKTKLAEKNEEALEPLGTTDHLMQ